MDFLPVYQNQNTLLMTSILPLPLAINGATSVLQLNTIAMERGNIDEAIFTSINNQMRCRSVGNDHCKRYTGDGVHRPAITIRSFPTFDALQ